jgi:glycosyltransferase involved in cell wall biosynthesis
MHIKKFMPTGPLVSVLVPVFNVSDYIVEALESIANQTYCNLEIIVVDDCSTDDTATIVGGFCKKDSRFVLLRHDRNMHIVAALNRALLYAKGQFIARCDGDDIMELDRIERQLEYLTANEEIDLVGCSLKFINESSEQINSYAFPSGSDLTRRLLRYSTAVSHIWLARREVYDVVGPYRIPTVEDYDFLLRADLLGFKLDNIPGYYGMRIRVRTDNTVGRYGIIQRKLFNYARAVNRAEKRGESCVYSQEWVDALIASGNDGILGKLHFVSDRVSYVASRKAPGLPKYGFIVLAALLSPYKFQYYLFATVRSLIIGKRRLP